MPLVYEGTCAACGYLAGLATWATSRSFLLAWATFWGLVILTTGTLSKAAERVRSR
jgi:hypothetical protein